MRIVTVKIPEWYLEAIDELVRMGRYASRSEAIRVAIRELLAKELWSSKSASSGARGSRDRRVEVVDL